MKQLKSLKGDFNSSQRHFSLVLKAEPANIVAKAYYEQALLHGSSNLGADWQGQINLLVATIIIGSFH